MKTEIQIFTDITFQEKINYMLSFYQQMIKKTNNPEYIAIFQSKLDEIKSYKDSEDNEQKLIKLYNRIMLAKEKTKQRKIQETQKTIQEHKEKLLRIQADDHEESPDEYLAENLANI